MHFDWGASHFVTKQLQIGAVGYAYQQLSCDSGAGNRAGCFESRVFGAGGQVGYVIPMEKTARLCECESLQGIRRRKSSLWLERLVDVRDFASRANTRARAAMKDTMPPDDNRTD